MALTDVSLTCKHYEVFEVKMTDEEIIPNFSQTNLKNGAEEETLDRKLKEFEMYEPGMPVDHKRQLIAAIENSILESQLEDIPSSPSLTARSKKSNHSCPVTNVLEEQHSSENQPSDRDSEKLLKKLPDSYATKLLQASKDKSHGVHISKPGPGTLIKPSRRENNTMKKAEKNEVEVIEMSDDSENDFQTRSEVAAQLKHDTVQQKTQLNEEFTCKMTKKTFAELQERAILVSALREKLNSVVPGPLAPKSFSAEDFRRKLEELKRLNDLHLRNIRNIDTESFAQFSKSSAHNSISKYKNENFSVVPQQSSSFVGLESSVEAEVSDSGSREESQPEVTIISEDDSYPDRSSCPICGKQYPSSKIETHASDCTDFGGLEAPKTLHPRTRNGRSRLKGCNYNGTRSGRHESTSPGSSAYEGDRINTSDDPEVEEFNDNDRKRVNHHPERRLREKRRRY